MSGEDTDPSGGSTDFTSELPGSRPSPIAEAVLAGLNITTRLEDVEHTLRKAMDASLLADNDVIMALLREVAENVAGAQHMATTLATPLAMAEQHWFEIQAAIPGFDSAGLTEDPRVRLQDLLKQNKKDAVQADESAVGSTPWDKDSTRFYRKRAELLESAFVESSDEHAVFVLLEDELQLAEKAFTDERLSGSPLSESRPQLTGATSNVYREAMHRLFKLIKAVRDIPGLEI